VSGDATGATDGADALTAAPSQPSDDPGTPRVAPGNASEIGPINTVITHAIGAVTGGGPPNVFTTLARHRRLFRPWLRFAGSLMPGGMLPRTDSELVILRVAHNCNCAYESQHHEHLGLSAGLTRDEIERVRVDPLKASWPIRQQLLLQTADELLATRTVSTPLWDQLREHLNEAESIELLLLIGHYAMLAGAINALRIQPDVLPDKPPLAQSLIAGVQRLAAKRRS
jgi:alkylhydroperoxidase family enzyme